MTKILITNDLQAVEFLEKLLNEDINDINTSDVKFEGWPIYKVHIEGSKYHTSVTPSMMTALLELQKGLYKTAAQVIYNESNTVRLTEDQRTQFEYTLKIAKGSTQGESSWEQIFHDILQASLTKMNGRQVLVLLLCAGLLYTGNSMYAHYLEAEEKTDIRTKEIEKATLLVAAQNNQAEIQSKLLQSQQEAYIKQVQVLTEAIVKFPAVEEIKKDSEHAHHEMLKKTASEVSITINGLKLTGAQAREIVEVSRSKSKAVKYSHPFRILAVDTTNPNISKVRVRYKSQEFAASFIDDSFDDRAIEFLQKHLHNRKDVQLIIEGRELNGKIQNARILSIANIDSKKPVEDNHAVDGLI